MSEKKCFVIAPIGEPKSETRKQSDLMLRFVIAPAVKELGYQTVRADNISESGMITNQIIQRIMEDSLVVADLSERNPNVYYELAVRHLVRKPLVHVMRQLQKGEEVPFDIAGTRIISVDFQDLYSIDKAKAEIISQVKALEIDPSKIGSPISVSIDLDQLKRFANPEQRSLAEIIATVSSDLRSFMLNIEKKIGQSEDNSIQEILEIVKSLSLNLQEPCKSSASIKADRIQLSAMSGMEEHIKTLEGRIEEREKDSQALDTLLKYLNPESEPSKEEIVKKFRCASPDMFLNIAQTLKGVRERYVYDILGANNDEFVKTRCAAKLSCLIPLFEALIEVESEDPTKSRQLYDHYAQLSYVYKDSSLNDWSKNDWNKTLELISKAIEQRDYMGVDPVFSIVYEVNRIVSYINLKKLEGPDIEKDFNRIWNTEDGQNELMRIHPDLSPGLREWLIQYKREKIIEWLKKNFNKQEGWLKSVPEKFRRVLEEESDSLSLN